MVTISALRTLPEKEEKNQRDQQHAVGEIAQHGVGGVMHQFAAVEVGNKFHALRAAGPPCPSFRSARRSSGGARRAWSSATAPLRSRTMPSTTSSSLMMVPSSLADGFAQLPEADFGGLHDVAQIADADRSAILYFDDGGGDVVGGLHQADGAHVERLLRRAR